MRRFLYIAILFLVAFRVTAQENVFIFVDVSQSGARTFKESEGRKIVQDIVLASFSKAKYPDWKLFDSISSITNNNIKQILNGSGMPLVMNNSVVGIIEIGNYNRHLSNRVFDRISTTTNFNDFLNKNYPSNVWKDDRTIIDLPMAWLASFLKSEYINNYYLFVLSDEQSDKGNPGTGIKYSNEDKKLIAEYGKGTKKPEKICTFNAVENGKEMYLTIWSVDLSGNPITPTTNTGIVIPSSEIFKIELTSFKGGTINKPIVHKSNKFTISWSCKPTPKNAQYKIRLSPSNVTREKTQTYTTSETSYSFSNISSGKWKILVSAASPDFNASSATTYIEVDPGSQYWFLWILLVIALGGLGYWYWKKRQNDKIKKLNSLSNSDPFSSSSTLNTNSDNSGYF